MHPAKAVGRNETHSVVRPTALAGCMSVHEILFGTLQGNSCGPSTIMLDRGPGVHGKGRFGESEPPVPTHTAYRQITLALVILKRKTFHFSGQLLLSDVAILLLCSVMYPWTLHAKMTKHAFHKHKLYCVYASCSLWLKRNRSTIKAAGNYRMIAVPVPRSKQYSTKPLRKVSDRKSPVRSVE